MLETCENRCLQLPCFPDDDDGVPPFCRSPLCPLDHRNKLLNDNECAKKIGYFGFDYFDRRRKLWLGLASWYTIFAMVLTTWGCFALSADRSIVQRTYWAGGTGQNQTSGQYFSLYVGLRSVEYVDCSFVPGYDSYPSNCNRQSIEYSSAACSEGPISAACEACANSATTMETTAFFSCLGLVLALLGAQTRMRVVADVPVQKMLGMGSDFFGSISLAVALFTFQNSCFASLKSAFHIPNFVSAFWIGPGLYCYAVCCVSGMIRAVAHWVTPLPGKGIDLSTCAAHYDTVALMAEKNEMELGKMREF